MNTSNVYFAEICRITDRKTEGNSIYTARAYFETTFFRTTFVFDKGDGKYLDLIGGRVLLGEYDYCSKVGTEFVDVSSLTPFNEVVGQHRRNLPKCLIRRKAFQHLYKDKQ